MQPASVTKISVAQRPIPQRPPRNSPRNKALLRDDDDDDVENFSSVFPFFFWWGLLGQVEEAQKGPPEVPKQICEGK